MKVDAKLANPKQVEIQIDITMSYDEWEAVHDALRLGIEQQAKSIDPSTAQELNAEISGILDKVVFAKC